MHVIESIKMAIYTILSNKMRTFLTILGIVIGISSVIAMVSIGSGQQKSMEEEFKKMGANKCSIYMAYGKDYSDKDLFNIGDIEAIREKYGDRLAGISFNKSMSTNYISGKKEIAVNLRGVNETYKNIENIKIEAGRFIKRRDTQSNSRVVVLDVDMADKQFGTRDILGKQLTLSYDDGSVSYTVVGLYSKEKSSYDSRSKGFNGYIADTLYSIDTGESKFEEITLGFNNKDSIGSDLNEITSYLEKLHGTKGEKMYQGYNSQKELNSMNKMTGAMTLFISAIAGISLLVGGIGIMNIMMVSVSERTREIGIRKAIGATRKDILSQFLVESALLSATGGIIGIILGKLAANLIGGLMNISPVTSIKTIIITVIFSSFMGVFFGMYPASKASKLHPIDALRYE